jgi:hypothetical protein
MSERAYPATTSVGPWRIAVNPISAYEVLVVGSVALWLLGNNVGRQVVVHPELRQWELALDHWRSAVAVLVTLGSLKAAQGLLRFEPWGRVLAVYMTAAWVLVEGFGAPGVRLAVGLPYAAQTAATLMWGAVLTLAYFGPVAKLFGNSAKPEDTAVDQV